MSDPTTAASAPAEHAQPQTAPPVPASPWRRFMACVYEGIILFGVVFFFGYGFSALTQYRGEPGALHTAFQLFMFAVLGAYFGWFWSNGRWTLPMKTIGVKLVRSTAPDPARPESIVTLPPGPVALHGGLVLLLGRAGAGVFQLARRAAAVAAALCLVDHRQKATHALRHPVGHPAGASRCRERTQVTLPALTPDSAPRRPRQQADGALRRQGCAPCQTGQRRQRTNGTAARGCHDGPSLTHSTQGCTATRRFHRGSCARSTQSTKYSV